MKGCSNKKICFGNAFAIEALAHRFDPNIKKNGPKVTHAAIDISIAA